MKSNISARQEEYVSPFSARYASKEMSYLFSSHYRALLFRKLWIALAENQKKLGLPISQTQISEMKKSAEEINFDTISEYEKKFRHDVMAHIHAFGDLCPSAKPIIHLGATSTFVTDNGDLIQMKEALQILFRKLIEIIRLLSNFAKKYAQSPCLAFTHFQSAQPTTIGKRASLWLQDFLLDAQEWERMIDQLPFLGVKGATGTQSSFLSLFKNDGNKVKKLEKEIAAKFGFVKILPISGQTYTRKIDLNILNAFESFAASLHKMATDIRLLAHEGELAEIFEKNQVGSSAMPFKKNPIYSERICGIARFVMSLAQNPAYTTATQWLERTLDDSSNKRLAIPEAFLGVDSILNLAHHLLKTLTPSVDTAALRLEKQTPFLAMENILMASVKKGGNRQELHEKLRKLSLTAQKRENPLNFLLSEIEKDSSFHLKKEELKPFLELKSLVGRAEEQTLDFLKEDILPFLSRQKRARVSIPSVEL